MWLIYTSVKGLTRSFWFCVFYWMLTLLVVQTFEIENHCINACPFQQLNRTGIADFDYGCNQTCKIEQCGQGCALWKISLKSSCRDVCNGTDDPLPPRQLYCVIGCNEASTGYFNELRDRIQVPPAPALVPDSLTATSLRLKWHFPEATIAADGGLSYLVQWRYEELADTWQYCRNQSWNAREDTVFVGELQPYTKYRFRVVLHMSKNNKKMHHNEMIVSEPSVVILTQAAGLPASAPVIVRAEIPAEQQYYTFRNLKASENYSISLRMSNEVGVGPASHIIVSTPMEATVKDNEKLMLFLRTDHKIFEQGIEILDEPKELYTTKEKIEGIALHVFKQILFLSDSAGFVYKLSLNSTTQTNSPRSFKHDNIGPILTAEQTAYAAPSLLSVDWLNGQLYILEEIRKPGLGNRKVAGKTWQIIRCGLDGEDQTVAVAGLNHRPKSMEVDPYNGFLFWVIHSGPKSGLYRLDLANISNGIKHDVYPEHILSESNLGAFTIDNNNFRLLISYQNNSTVYSVSLDGKEVYNIRKKVAATRMEKITSLAYTNKKFYWTNDSRLFYEEYHEYTDSYYQNSYPDFNNAYKTVLVNLASAQPIPIPVNPPRAVQAIFGMDKAKVSWLAPHLLGGQGKGAWQDWSYELSVKDVLTGHVDSSHRNITSTSYTLYNLLPNRQYVIKASAYTDHGTGPWSSEFSGRTLRGTKEDEDNSPTLFWATNNGLLRSDATGDGVVTLLDTTIKGNDASNSPSWKNSHFTDMAWYANQLYLVSNNSKVYWYNTTTRKSGEIFGIGSVGSIAIDWIGKKLYWSNPQKQLINRGNLDGSQQEPLPIITLAKELNIDSVNAYIYWSSGYSVECSHLNGANKILYHPAELFEKQVMGLTLDTDQHYIYWIVRGSEGSHLYRAPMMSSNHTPSSVTRTHMSFNTERLSYNLPRGSSTMRGPLRYFHDRLLWLGDDRRAVIGDLHENKTAVVAGELLSGLNMVYIVDAAVYKLPNTTKIPLKDISVIPEPVHAKSIEIQGSWQSFNVTWNPVKKVNYGTVFYEIKIDTDLITNDTAVITTSPSIRYHRTIPPYTPLHITIRPYTYYSTSVQPPPTQLHVRSPESTPESALHLRAYVTHLHMRSLLAEDIRVTFRWRPPARVNGVIKGYRVRCWFKEHDGDRLELCEGVVVQAGGLEYVLGGLLENETYYFQVQAFTVIGDGELSPVLSISTTSQYPVPTLILTGQDTIYRLDVDNNRTESILSNVPTPIELAYLLTENRLFWINDASELFMYNTGSLIKTKVLIEEDNLSSVTVDWLERAIYYVKTSPNDSTICKVDLNRLDKGHLKKYNIMTRVSKINKVEVSPFTQKLFWTEVDNTNNTITLLSSHTNGTNITRLFANHKDHKAEVSKCDCPNISDSISKSFTLDHSQDKNNPSLVIIDTKKNEILTADTSACHCKIISTKITNHNINDIKIDRGFIYWTSKMNLYIVNRNTGELTIKESLHATDVSIFGTHMQPYPNTECLMPKVAQNLSVALINTSSHSVTLSMPSYVPHDDCQHVTIATIEYHIYYRPYNRNNSLLQDDVTNLRCNENCTEEVSFERNVTVNNLSPFSRYVFAVSIGNYYTDIAKKKVIIGQGVVYLTAVGAPSHARNVTATVLTPNLIRVCWTAPRYPNGDQVHYEVHWETDGRATTGIRQKGDLIYLDDSQLMGNNDDMATVIKGCEHRAFLKDLTPYEIYIIGARAFSSRNQSLTSPGDRVQVRTFPEPDNITVIDIKPYELFLQWNISYDAVAYNIQFALLTSTTWENISETLIKKDRGKNSVTVSVQTLTAKTFYKFRLILKYPLYNQLYYWPKDHRFTFETLGDKPTTPGIPLIQHINEVYQVSWEASKANGAQIEEYLLEMMKIRNYRVKRSTNRSAYSYLAPSIEETEFEWETAYNGTGTFWKVEELTEKYKYVFRVKARNSYGWSNLSGESVEFDWSSATQVAEKQDYTIIMIAVFIMIVLMFMAIFCGLVACNCCKSNKKSQQIVVAPRGQDVELATLRELPRRSNFIHNTNILYISTQISPEQMTLLPHIRRDQITLTKFLGSGAFGEVFEGTAKGCANMHGNVETKVAVKTLRKGASDQEKTEFLQEAQLMSHFKHGHILQLLGVCLDNDPHFIIMELMQGGDLLTYLRLSRKSSTSSLQLTLLDLIRMCLDVAKGCRYLEEMHFVHRDLACRNCLVSSTDPNNRIVKIGDFGLARDIYKNDYYRKEGEGLLPVRWMAPESLVDGVFTSQSDVWAFGVLLWEIMTLGQQPYPARNNLEVLHYVRRGGRLGKPVDCPEDLHALMLKCWSYEAERRPTFKHCLEILERLYLDLLSNPVAAIHTGQYISTVPLRNSWKSGSESETSRERTPFLSEEQSAREIPKYLELLYDGEPPAENDGYEIPRTVPFVNQPSNVDSVNINSNLESKVELCKNIDIDDNSQLILKEAVNTTNVGYTNMTPERNKIINTDATNNL